MNPIEAREKLNRIIERSIANSERISAPDITRKVARTIATDVDLLTGLLYETVGHRVTQYLNSTRTTHKPSEPENLDRRTMHSNADRAIRRTVFGNNSKFEKWMEYNGHVHVQFMRMNRNDCFAAAGIRRQRVFTERVRSTLLETIGNRLKEGEVVEDVLSPEQVDQLEREITNQLERRGGAA